MEWAPRRLFHPFFVQSVFSRRPQFGASIVPSEKEGGIVSVFWRLYSAPFLYEDILVNTPEVVYKVTGYRVKLLVG